MEFLRPRLYAGISLHYDEAIAFADTFSSGHIFIMLKALLLSRDGDILLGGCAIGARQVFHYFHYGDALAGFSAYIFMI